ncbi:hypothetical protein QF037_004474 [Streptomyces canus]|uniref:hypothetical protein n=1 Tax=Streptomyces canus TaxID=58343 RepID=UPI00277E4C11|nr:hypothetical protein [Streptomyces canus]MDQ0600129.1 hypothetical protein [Streptomyces canus]
MRSLLQRLVETRAWRVARVVAYTLAGLISVVIFVVLPVIAQLSGGDDDDEGPPDGSATPSATFTPVRWTYQGDECADGWSSDSIGRQGACSHHGGVVSVFEGADGTVLRCGDDEHTPRPDEQQQQIDDYGHVLCVFR